MENLKPVLADQPFCKGLDDRYLDLLAGCSKNVVFEAGEFVFHVGEEANHLFLIRSGRVAIEIDPPGRGPVTIQTLGNGDILGWSWMVPPYQYCYDAQAIKKTQVISVDANCLRKNYEEDHSLGYELFKRLVPVIGQRMHSARMQLLDMYSVPSKG